MKLWVLRHGEAEPHANSDAERRSWQAAAILRDLAGINIVGGDVVEVSPPYDTTGATAIAGAHVAYELICLYHWARTQR